MYGYEQLRRVAVRQLDGVGDASLGEWEEWTGRALHIRRRLSVDEQGPLAAIDIRKSPEYGVRRAAIQPFLPEAYKNWQE